jgi:hypothetical protein
MIEEETATELLERLEELRCEEDATHGEQANVPQFISDLMNVLYLFKGLIVVVFSNIL